MAYAPMLNGYEELIRCVLPFCRISTVLITMPIVGSDWVPKKIKLMASILMTWFFYPIYQSTLPPETTLIPLWLVQEILLGLLIGLMAQIWFQVIIAAGEIVAFQSSLSFATLFDSSTHFHIPVLSQIYQIFFFLLYLSFQGPIFLMQVLSESFHTFPMGQFFVDSTLGAPLFSGFSWIIKGGIMAILPIWIALLVVNIGMGVVSKAVPQINILSIGFPVYVSTLLVLLVLSIEGLYGFFEQTAPLLVAQYRFLM